MSPADRIRSLASELDKTVEVLLSENAELRRRNEMIGAQLDDALDGFHEFRRRITELEMLNEELRELKEAKRESKEAKVKR